MAEATERVWKEDDMGVERLVAAPGDEIPDEDAPVGYQEKTDPRADTADAYRARGEKPPKHASRRTQPTVENITVEPDVEYEDPPPKPGEEDNGGGGSTGRKARRSSSAEDKAAGPQGTKAG